MTNNIVALQRIAIGLLLLVAGSQAQAVVSTPAYRLLILDPQSAYTSSDAFGVNNHGQAAGTSYSQQVLSQVSSRWTTNSALSVPAGPSGANGINDLGHIVGAQFSGSGTQVHAYFFDGVTAVDIHTSTMATIGNFSTALAVNNFGQVVGFASPSAAGNRAAYLWKEGATILLGTLGGPASSAYDINDTGVVSGSSETPNGNTRAMRWFDGNGNNSSDPGEMVQLPDMGLSSAANAINDLNQTAGFVLNSAFKRQPVIWNNPSAFVSLPLLAGADDGEVFGINNQGDAVGDTMFETATLWQGGQAYNLNHLIAPGSGYTLTSARSINDRGWIAGTAFKPGIHARGYLLIPVPEPATFWLLATLVVAKAVGRSRR